MLDLGLTKVVCPHCLAGCHMFDAATFLNLETPKRLGCGVCGQHSYYWDGRVYAEPPVICDGGLGI